jgi:hypothetical protein
MKKRILMVATIIVATAAWMAFTAPEATSIHNPLCQYEHVWVKEGKKCSCGGDLEWKATAYKEYTICSLCKGKGTYGKEKCTLCKGSGKDYVWKSGYVCKRCGRIYKD